MDRLCRPVPARCRPFLAGNLNPQQHPQRGTPRQLRPFSKITERAVETALLWPATTAPLRRPRYAAAWAHLLQLRAGVH
eukprot:9232666-Lingulodinium_polyedra.AAC.1